MSLDEQEEDHVDWYVPKLLRFKEFITSVKELLKSGEEASDTCHDDSADKQALNGVSDGVGLTLKLNIKENEDNEVWLLTVHLRSAAKPHPAL